jgi:CshA-type fibril repeat protein
VSFVPALGFTGTAAAVAYRVTDAFGRTATATYTPAVTKPAPPSAPSLTSSGPAGAAQSQSVTAPVGTTIALVGAGGTPVTRISVPGEGTYVVDTGAGTIRFVPDAGFIGRATPIHYLLRDAYGQATDATYAATVVPGATIARIAPVARVGTHVVLGVSDTVPVRCALSDTPVTGCSVVLQAVVGGRPVAVGHGAIRAVGHPGTVVVKVHLTALGRTLTARLGGARFVAVATVRGAGGAYRARVATHVVAATVPVNGPFLYRPDSTAMSTRTRAALVRLRVRLAGARSVVCIGLAEGKPSDPDKDDWAPAIARARAACALLGHAHGVATHVQGRWTYLADDDGLPWIAGLRIVVRY